MAAKPLPSIAGRRRLTSGVNLSLAGRVYCPEKWMRTITGTKVRDGDYTLKCLQTRGVIRLRVVKPIETIRSSESAPIRQGGWYKRFLTVRSRLP